MTALSAVFWGLIVISLLVVVHEGGHFLVARAFGIRVTEFFIGMPSKARLSWRSKKYGTEFGITPVLLGGYNRICGMEPLGDEHMPQVLAIVQRDGTTDAVAIAEELGISADEAYDNLLTLSDWASIARVEAPRGSDKADVFTTQRRDARLLTMYDKGHDFTTSGVTEAGEPRPIADADSFCEQERLHTYDGKAWWKRILILLAGAAVNIAIAFFLVIGDMTLAGIEVVSDTNVISGVEQGGLAEQAGLQAGDRIVGIAGERTDSWTDISAAVDSALGAAQPFEVLYERDGVSGAAEIDLPSDGSATAIGIYASTEIYHASLVEATRVAVAYVGQVGTMVAQILMPQHTVEIVSQSSSVVGISVMASQAASSGASDFIALLAAVSLSLGFMNLLPIPPLDGGKILIEIIQAIRGKRVSMKAQTAISYVGLAFFMVIFVFALFNDVTRIIG